jgi:sarcosine oxidase subunit alpha
MSFRLAKGGRIDRTRAITFRFDGRPYTGHPGDTLASALLANGVRFVGRSFKYHRPRGVFTCGPEEPNALVELRTGARREPNARATTAELFEGLEASSQNRWPSLRLDIGAVNGLVSAFLPAGFYYKTFMWPPAFWEKVYEPIIRRAAGLGRAAREADPDHYEHRHAHCDVMVVGAGAAGLAAARAAGEAGARVILAEQDFLAGGGTLLEPALAHWRNDALATIGPEQLLLRATVLGAYGHGVFAAMQRLTGEAGHAAADRQRLRLHVIRTRYALFATGALDRLIAFPGNDRPGIMLADAARTYADRFAVAPGRRVAFFLTNDAAYDIARTLHARGLEIPAIVDSRPASSAATAARAAGITVLAGHEIVATSGRLHLSGIHVRPRDGGSGRHIDADAMVVSGGLNPQTQLASQAGLPLAWSGTIAAFLPRMDDGAACAIGAARGIFGLRDAAADGRTGATRALAALGLRAPAVPLPDIAPDPADATPLQPLWQVRAPGKAFVDLQHDVTTDDVRLAQREGYTHVEHMKRYTTHAMATDQGKSGGLVGVAVLAEARGATVAEVGLPTSRPFVHPVPWAALAGAETGTQFKPERRLPLHDWHAANGAVFVRIGLWLRPLVYSPSRDTSWGPVLDEARKVRTTAGLTDVSSLGKIDVQGPGAAAFLDRIYANTISTLPVGRARYGLMLREDGIVLDDGTIARLAPEHFLLTTTTQKADDVLLHMEWHLAAVWPALDVTLTGVADNWAQFALAGPHARDVLAPLVADLDIAGKSLPFMGVTSATIAGVPGRLFRISFSGEPAFEIAVPAGYAHHVWSALLAAGRPHAIAPYGLDALNVLRIEKGHVTGAEIDGQTTADDLGLGHMLKKSGDFVGRSLSARSGLRDPRRLQLVGLHAIDPLQRIRGGAHLVRDGSSDSEGHVTSTCMSVSPGGWIALAMLAGGRARHGERIIATNPVFGEHSPCIVGSPHRFDPENARVRT